MKPIAVIAEALEVSAETLRRYATDTRRTPVCPHERRKGGAIWMDLRQVRAWMRSQELTGKHGDQEQARIEAKGKRRGERPTAGVGKGGDGEDLKGAKLKEQVTKLREENRRLRNKNAKDEGDLVVRAEIHAGLAWYAARLKKAADILLRNHGRDAFAVLDDALSEGEQYFARQLEALRARGTARDGEGGTQEAAADAEPVG